MQLYRCTNKNHRGSWIIAENCTQAKQTALSTGLAKRLENLTVVDQTEFYLTDPSHQHHAPSLERLLETQKAPCLVCYSIPAYSFAEVLSGSPQSSTVSEWVVLKDLKV